MVDFGPGCKLNSFDLVEALGRSAEIVVDMLFLDDLPSIPLAAEQTFAETLIPKPSAEALDEAILHRLAWGDIVPFDTAMLLPGEYDTLRQFCPIVTEHNAGIAMAFSNRIQLTCHPFVRDRVVNDRC